MSLQSIGSIGNIALWVFAIASIVLAALLGLKRGVFKSAVRTVSLLLSALVSFFLVKLLLPSLLKMLTDVILDSFSKSEGAFSDILQAETSFTVLEALVLAIIAPLVFVFVYFIINKVFLIICFIVNTVLKPIVSPIEKKIPCHRLFGALISVIGALVTLAVISTPIVGYSEMFDRTIDHVEESGSDNELLESLNAMNEVTQELSDNAVISISYKMGGKLFFNSLTSIHIEKNEGVIDEDIKTSLEDEIIGVLDLIPVAESFSEMSFSDIEGMNIDPLRKVAETLSDEESSAIVRVMMADIFATASTRWLNGESYLTINLMELLEGDAAMFRPSVEVILGGLANTHVSSVGQDVITLVETFDGIQNTFLNMMQISATVTGGGKIQVDDVMGILESLTPQSAAAMSASLPAVMTQAGVQEDYANPLSNVLSGALAEMADMNVNSTDRAEVEREAEALRTVLTVAMNPSTDMTEEEADDLIETVMNSSVLSHSIQNTVKESEEDSAPSMALTEASAAQVQQKIDAYESENDLDEEQKETLDSLRVFFASQTVSEDEEVDVPDFEDIFGAENE